MKKFILFSTIVLLCIGTSQAQKSKKMAEMTFKDIKHNFGEIEYAGNGTYEFVFKNTGKADLIIKNVSSSCGCTVPTWPKAPIKKRKKGTIKVKYDTKRLGSFYKTITIYSNAKNSPITLTISGNIKKK